MQLTIKDSNKHFFTRIQIEREEINNKLVHSMKIEMLKSAIKEYYRYFSLFCCLTNWSFVS